MTRLADRLADAREHLTQLAAAHVCAEPLLWTPPVSARPDRPPTRGAHTPAPEPDRPLARVWCASQLRIAAAHHAIRRLGAVDGWNPAGTPLTRPVPLPVVLDALGHAMLAVAWLHTLETAAGGVPRPAAGDAFALCYQLRQAAEVWPPGFHRPRHPAQKRLRYCAGCGDLAARGTDRAPVCEACYLRGYRAARTVKKKGRAA